MGHKSTNSKLLSQKITARQKKNSAAQNIYKKCKLSETRKPFHSLPVVTAW